MDNPQSAGQASNLVVEVKMVSPETQPEKRSIDAIKALEVVLRLGWLVFGVTVFCLFFHQIRDEFIPNISSISIGGISATLKDFDVISSKDAGNSDFKSYISPKQRELLA